jgi:periplasmic protein TonB
MTARLDILDQPERLRGPFWTSVAFHAGMFGAFFALSVINPFSGKVEHWGDPKGGGFGSVAVTAVPSIPLPNRGAVPNPVANDTESQVPQAPSKVKAQPKVKAPDPDAIPIKSRHARERAPREAAAAPNKYADQQPVRPGQLYSTGGAAANSPLYNQPGAGGVGFGNNSPFGTQFGAYANMLRQKIASNWHTTDVNPRLQTAPVVVVQFTIRRDGSMPQGLPRIVQSSGDTTLDRSAQRAIMDAAPFQPLPPQFDRNEANVELGFQLKR